MQVFCCASSGLAQAAGAASSEPARGQRPTIEVLRLVFEQTPSDTARALAYIDFSSQEIAINEPLPWPVYNDKRQLLLRAGFAIETSVQLEKLIVEHKPKLVYLVPTFGNPSGAMLSLARRKRVLELAAQYKVPVIPFGVGSSLEGHLLAVQGGISIDLSRMNQVLHIHAEDLTVTVQPGETEVLTYTFDEPGPLQVGCHQKGPYAAGMRLTVLADISRAELRVEVEALYAPLSGAEPGA